MLYFFISIYIIAFIILIVTCYVKRFKKYHVWCKCISSAGFLLVAVYGGLKSPENSAFWELFPALFFCFLGDFFLAKRSENKPKKNFILGLFSFLIAHCLFVVGLSFVQGPSVALFVLPFLGVIMTVLLLQLKKMVVGSFKKYILIYSYFVSALFFKCGQVYLNGTGNRFCILVLLGGSLFLLSDFIILFLYFYQKRYGIIKFLNLLTYYAATFMLALSIFLH